MCQAKWRLQLLGGVVAERADARVDRFQTKQTAALLALLARSSPSAVPRDELIRLLWGEGDRKQLRNRLNQAISSLRRALEGNSGSRLFSSSHYALSAAQSSFATDVAEFEAAAAEVHEAMEPSVVREAALRAADLYRGDYLAGMEFEWALRERARLKALFVHCLGDGIQACLATDRLEDGAKLAAERARVEPGTAAYQAELAKLLLASGRPQQAIAHINAFEAGLQIRGSELPSDLQELRSQALASPHSDLLPIPVSGWQSAKPRVALPPAPKLLGRKAELDGIVERMRSREGRLLVITGLGGLGKTALMLAALRRYAEEEGASAVVVTVPDALQEPCLAHAVVAAAGVPDPGTGEKAVAQLVAVGKLALGLDGVEALPAAWAAQLGQLIESCPGLNVVATGRRPTGLSHELRIALDPLRTRAEPGEAHSPALQLFLATMAKTAGGYAPGHLDSIHKLCVLLEGHPLAIELAAGWSRVLDPAQILDRLEASQSILVDTSLPEGVERGSFRSVVESSLALAGPGSRQAFLAMGVFCEAATLEAVEAVTGATPEAVRELEELGLLRSTAGSDGATRLTMLSTLREYARSSWDSRQAESIRGSHARHFLGRARDLLGQPDVAGNAQALRALAAEFGDHAAAVAYWAAGGEGDAAVEHACHLSRLAETGDKVGETTRLLEEALRTEGVGDRLRTQGEARLARLLWLGGSFARAKEMAGGALKAALACGDASTAAAATAVLQTEAHRVGDYGLAQQYLAASLEIAAGLGDRAGEARAKLGMGNLSLEQGRLADAERSYLESLGAAREASDPYWTIAALANLAHLAVSSQRSEAALDLVERAEQAAGNSPAFRRLFHAIYSVQAHALLALGRVEEAEASLRRATHHWPETAGALVEVLTAAADVLSASGSPERSAAVLGFLAARSAGAGHAPGLEAQRRAAIGERVAIAIGEAAYGEHFFSGSAMDEEEVRALVDFLAASNGASVL